MFFDTNQTAILDSASSYRLYHNLFRKSCIAGHLRCFQLFVTIKNVWPVLLNIFLGKHFKQNMGSRGM